jgi:hypothetical protein
LTGTGNRGYINTDAARFKRKDGAWIFYGGYSDQTYTFDSAVFALRHYCMLLVRFYRTRFGGRAKTTGAGFLFSA